MHVPSLAEWIQVARSWGLEIYEADDGLEVKDEYRRYDFFPLSEVDPLKYLFIMQEHWNYHVPNEFSQLSQTQIPFLTSTLIGMAPSYPGGWECNQPYLDAYGIAYCNGLVWVSNGTVISNADYLNSVAFFVRDGSFEDGALYTKSEKSYGGPQNLVKCFSGPKPKRDPAIPSAARSKYFRRQ